MNLRSIIEIVLPMVVLFIASQIAHSDGVKGRFATPQCAHDQLAPAIGEMASCEIENWHNYVEKSLKNFKDQLDGGKTFDLKTECELHNELLLKEGKECPVNFAESCLPDYISQFVGELYDALHLDCNCPNFHKWDNGQWSQMGDSNCKILDQQKVNASFAILFEGCAKDKKCPEKLFTFDKKCEGNKRGEEFMSSVVPCLKENGMPMVIAIMGYFNGVTNLDNISPCTTVGKVLDECFKENTCFSQREMELIRNLAATGYNGGMKSLLQVDEEFGSITEYVNAHNDLTLKWHDNTYTLPEVVDISEPTTKKALDFADHIVQDYKSDVCKPKQKEFERMEQELNGSSTRNVEIFQWILPLALLLGRRYLF